MTILEFLNNIKRVGTPFRIVNGWGAELWSGTVSNYKHNIFKGEFDNIEIFMIAFDKGDVMEIQIDTDDL